MGSIFVPKILTKGNMVEMMDFLKTHKALAALDLCTEFLLENSNRNSLQSSDLLSKHPEIAVHLLRENNLRQNTIQLFDKKGSSIFHYEKDQTVSNEFKIQPIPIDYSHSHTTWKEFPGLVFTGLGLALCKGAEVEVCIYALKEEEKEDKIYHGTVINLTNKVLPIFFQKEVSCKKYHNNSVEGSNPKFFEFRVEITGSRFANNAIPHQNGTIKDHGKIKVFNCKDKYGEPIGRNGLEFRVSGKSYHEIP